VTCIQNVLVRQQANNFALQHAQSIIQETNSGNGGDRAFTQAPLEEKQQLGNTVFNYVVNTVLPQSGISKEVLPKVQQNLVAERQQQTDLATMLGCHTPQALACEAHLDDCPGANAQEKWAAQANVIALEPQCTVSGATAIASTYESGLEADKKQEYDQVLALGNGLIPKEVCADPGKSQDTPADQCVNRKIVTPSAAQVAIVQQAYTLGATKQSSANEIGELVNNLFSQLTSKVLTSLNGSVGLSQPSTGGGGSYLQQAVSTNQDATISQARTALVNDIETSIGIEAQYEAILSNGLDNLTTAKNAAGSAKACYLALATSTPTNIDSSTALGRANDASTTEATVIIPQIDRGTNLLSLEDSVIAQLNLLDDQAKTLQSPQEINAIAAAYQALVASGALHNQNDLAFLAQDRDASKVTLDALTAGAKDALSTCQKGG
jgi:hypothetical protein